MKALAVATILILSGVVGLSVFAQDDVTLVECGDIIEGEITFEREVQNFGLDLTPESTVSLEFRSMSQSLTVNLYVRDPLRGVIGYSGASENNFSMPHLQIGANGVHIIEVQQNRGAGMYILNISCSLSDGSTIAPAGGSSSLAPTDFSRIPLFTIPSATALRASFSPSNDETYAYSFDGVENQSITVEAVRITGTLNIGLVVLDPDGTLMFYGGILVNNWLSVTLTLPVTGNYIIGVFQPELDSPAEAQPTIAEISIVDNP